MSLFARSGYVGFESETESCKKGYRKFHAELLAMQGEKLKGIFDSSKMTIPASLTQLMAPPDSIQGFEKRKMLASARWWSTALVLGRRQPFGCGIKRIPRPSC